MIRPVMMYGAEAWTLRRKEEKFLERTEMRMLRWILGISLKDMQRNENIRKKIGVACITDKIREARLRWYGHVERSGDTNIRRIMKSRVQGLRSRGRQKKRWMDMIQEDLKFLNLIHFSTPGEETCGGRGSEWLTPRRRGINSSLKEKKNCTNHWCFHCEVRKHLFLFNCLINLLRSNLVQEVREKLAGRGGY